MRQFISLFIIFFCSIVSFGQELTGHVIDRNSNLVSNGNVKIKKQSNYWFTAGWGNPLWNVSMNIINPPRSHWRGDVATINTPNYSMQTTTISINEHQRLNLTVAYTFGYGKKVTRGNDLIDEDGAESSIR